MARGIVQFQLVSSEWIKHVKDVAAVSRHFFRREFETQARLLGAELMKRTPPFSGRTIKRMLETQGKQIGWRDAEIENMSAFRVGCRRVEKDIRRVIYGVRGAAMPKKTAQVYKGQNRNPVMDWGVLQRCENKPAVRIYATKKGEIYGVDLERFQPHASDSVLKATHEEHRTKRGRVTTAGTRDRVIGRWRWLNVLVTSENIVRAFIEKRKKMVGQGKGGWASLFTQCGGKMSQNGWVGRHEKTAGTCIAKFDGDTADILATNRSAWASSGDDDRIVEQSMQGRGRAMEANIKGQIEKRWNAH